MNQSKSLLYKYFTILYLKMLPQVTEEGLHIHQAVLTGEVLDGASLETIWRELTVRGSL